VPDPSGPALASGAVPPESPDMAVPVRDAATVMLVRDGDRGPEVFMLRRSLRSVFVGGAYVFPGGAVDASDRAPELQTLCPARRDATASALLGVPDGGLAFWVAAVRECFEEAGVLLAGPVSFDDPEVAARFEAHRERLNDGATNLAEICRVEGLTLDVGAIHYFAHWITPLGAPRRYDTRFFVAAAPAGQVGLHDDREVIANVWVRPSDALERRASGEYELIEPTFRTLQALERFASAAELLDAARRAEDDPDSVPRMSRSNEGVRIPLPGD
jgi:8-oxo-dGTP pyrophosphatase MutT (NUDIX family)